MEIVRLQPFSYSSLANEAKRFHNYTGCVAMVAPSGKYIYVPFHLTDQYWREAIVLPFNKRREDHGGGPEFPMDEYGAVKTILKSASHELVKHLGNLL